MIALRELLGEEVVTYGGERPTSHRVLMALRWYDWIEPIELYDHLQLEVDSRDRNTHQQALGELIKRGVVERKTVRHPRTDGRNGTVSTTYVRLVPNAAEVLRRRRA